MIELAAILIIEDNPTNRDLMVYLLQTFGHEPISCGTGEDGVAAALRDGPSLILCDLQLPGIDGYEVLRQLKGDHRLRRIPILAVTALAMVGDRDRALAAGFDGYIAKPIDPETFVQELARFLPAEASDPCRRY